MAQPMVNGTSYSWSQIELRFSNIVQEITGVTNIDYSEEQKAEFNFGANNRPVSRGFGNVVASASVTLHMDDIEAIRSNIPSGNLGDLGEFDVVISFLHPDSAKIISHTIKNCYINENGVSVGQDDTIIEKQLNLNPSHVLWNDSLILGLEIL
tara:strand:- start:26465 stop:26923 length:459 start_codon:yes stop_codon:yes gene_type:complete